jgi:hypothetical protein
MTVPTRLDEDDEDDETLCYNVWPAILRLTLKYQSLFACH